MRLWSNRYYMLVCSLPTLPARFDAGPLPISAERLQDRLRLLKPDDAEEMSRLFDVLVWTRTFGERTDAAVVARYGELLRRIRRPLVREVAEQGMDVRMILTALRRRRRGLGPPEIGVGRWLDHIRRHFSEPDFALGRAFPRLGAMSRLLERDDPMAFHRALLGATWDQLKRRADDHLFDFEAVVLYVARWEIMRSWRELRPERGREVFESLVTEALGNYAELK
jgi:hypothetical protein